MTEAFRDQVQFLWTILHFRFCNMDEPVVNQVSSAKPGTEVVAEPVLPTAAVNATPVEEHSDVAPRQVEACITVTFESDGPLGLVLRDDMLVADTAPGSASRFHGIQPGDFLTHVGGVPVESIGGLQDVLASLRAAPRPLVIQLRRAQNPAVSATGGLPPSLAAKDAGAVDSAGSIASVSASVERPSVKIAQSARTAVASAGSALKSFLSTGAQAIAAVDRAIDRAIDQSAKVRAARK